MRMKLNIRNLIPQTLGGNTHNIWDRLFHMLVPQTLGGRRRNVWNELIDMPRLTINRKRLWEFIKNDNCKKILEIGLGQGKNAKKMIELGGEDCDYYCFDLLAHPDAQAAYLELKDMKNVHFYIGDTNEVLPEVISQLPKMDVIFADGGHDLWTIKNDWEKICEPLMHDGTAVFFHDYDDVRVRRVVGEIGDGFSVEIIKPSAGPRLALVKKKVEK